VLSGQLRVARGAPQVAAAEHCRDGAIIGAAIFRAVAMLCLVPS
jgi:hypothetical protein